ncbi:HAD hydrolase-like protein, partial [Escherichia coli]
MCACTGFFGTQPGVEHRLFNRTKTPARHVVINLRFRFPYRLAAEKLNVPIGEILHVGDDLTTDVGGAIRSGMQACWIRPENGDLMQTWDSRLLPHLEISRLASLTSLI